MNLAQKLIAIRSRVQYLQKENSGEGLRYKYVSSSQTLGAVRAAMDELGVLLIPAINSQTVEHIEQETKSGKRTQHFTTLAMVYTWINADDPTERISVAWAGQGTDDAEKGIGKALTYSEKYFILKALQIATDKDDPDAYAQRIAADEEPAPRPEPAKPRTAKPPPAATLSMQAVAAFAALGVTQEDLEKYLSTPISYWGEKEINTLRLFKDTLKPLSAEQRKRELENALGGPA